MSTSDAESWRSNVAAIVLDDADNVLLGVTSPTSRHVHFPQGGVNRSESMKQAVLREVGEEVGIRAEHLTVLARYGGLRYRYRSKNRKSHVWDGQEQTYFVLHCPGIRPATDTTASGEFVRVQWRPWYTLDAGLFVSFKQAVMRQVLAHFFPRHLPASALREHLEHNCRINRYLSPARHSAACGSTDDRFLFAGGREEVEAQFADASRELLDLQRQADREGTRLLVIPFGLPGCGRRHCLRRLARCMDPLRTRIAAAAFQPGDALLTSRFLAAEPLPGQAAILLDSPYDTLLHGHGESVTRRNSLDELLATEQLMQSRGVRILRLYLNTADEVALKRCRKNNCPTGFEELRRLRSLADELMEPADWYLIPSDRQWYRNLMVIRAVSEALGSC